MGNKSDLSSPPTAVEYFGAIMTTLEADSEERNHTNELMSLLSTVLQHVSTGLIKSKFAAVSTFLVSFISDDTVEEMELEGGSVYKHIIACLGVLLSTLDPSYFSSKQVSKILTLLLQYSVDKIPKARRESHRVLTDLLIQHSNCNSTILGEKSASFCSDILEKAYEGQDVTRTLQLLTFLRSLLPVLPSPAAYKLIESLVRFLNSDNSLLVLGSYRTISSYIVDEKSDISTEDLKSLIEVLIENVPDPSQPDAASEFILLITAVLMKINKVEESHNDESVLSSYIAVVVRLICVNFSSDDRGLTKIAQRSLRDLILTCIHSEYIDRAITGKEGPVIDILTSFEALTSYRFHNSWNAIVEPTAAIFKVIGSYSPACAQLLSPLTLSLVDMYEAAMVDASDEDYSIQVHRVVGIAVESLGSERFLSIVSLSNSKDNKLLLAPKREWLLPLLDTHSQSSPCSLSFFGKHILTMARAHMEASKVEGAKPKDITWNSNCSIRLWRLLPAWCEAATDTSVMFPNMVKTLVAAANDNRFPELGKIVCQSLTNIIQSNLSALNDDDKSNTESNEDFSAALYDEDEVENEDEEEGEEEEEEEGEEEKGKFNKPIVCKIDKAVAKDNIDALSPFAATFLPLLFNLYDQAHGVWPGLPAACPHLGYGTGNLIMKFIISF